MAKFIDKILDKIDDLPSMDNTGKIHWFFGNFERVNMSEHGKRSNELNIILEHERGKCFIQSANGCFPKSINYIFKEDLSMLYFELIQSNK